MQTLLSQLKFFVLALFTFILLACGGGGEGTNPIGGGTGSTGDTGDTGGVGGDDGDVTGNGFALSIRLYEDGVSTAGLVAGSLPDTNTISSVSSVEAGVVAVGVVDSSGAPVAGAIVTVTASSGNLTPSNGFVLTNASGVAAATLDAGAAQSGSAGVLSAELEGATASLNYSIGSVDLQLGRDSNSDGNDLVYTPADYEDGLIATAIATLSPTGSTELEVVVVDANDALFTSPLTVNFASACSQLNPPQATLDTSVTTVGGVATSTYTAAGCEGTDSITATIEEVPGVSASGSVEIETAAVNSIVFVSAEPESIALQGTGGADRPEFSNLTFRVLDEADLPAQGETVTFELSTSTGGITLTSTSGITDGDGDVTVGVNAGSVPTSVRVTANLDLDGDAATTDDIISTVSDSLVISTGLPDNDSFSLSASILNPGGNDIDGITSDITIRASDAFNNPAPDGTVVNFTTEYGSIQPSCTTVDGACTVEWNSQSPRAPLLASTGEVLTITSLECDLNGDGAIDGSDTNPATGIPCANLLVDPADPDYPGQIFGGRTTITATAIGEESFVDANGNGLYDTGEAFVDLPEAFYDHNEDGTFGGEFTTGSCLSDTGGACAGWEEGGAEEEHADFDSNGAYDLGNGIYNGSLCPETLEIAGDCTRTLVNVRDSVVLHAGGSTPFIGVYGTDGVALLGADQNVDVTTGDPADANRTIIISDVFNGTLPAGTSIEVSNENCEVFGLTSFEIPNSSAKGNFGFGLSFGADTNTTATQSITITVTPPASAGGVVVVETFTCTDI